MIGRTNVGGGAGGGGTLEEKTVALNMSSGDQEITPSSGYDGLTKAIVTKPATLIPENIKKNVVIGGITGSFEGEAIPSNLDNLVDGTLTSFTMPSGKGTVKQYLFYRDTILRSANLQGATTIGDYAFSECGYAAIQLPTTLRNIGRSAFYQAGIAKVSGQNMELHTINPCQVLASAFSGSDIKKVSGIFSLISEYAFQSCVQLQEVDITYSGMTFGNGSIFNACALLLKLHIVVQNPIAIPQYFANGTIRLRDISLSGTFTALGNYAFQGAGYLRSNPASDILVFDFSTSTFPSVGQYCFGALSSSNDALNYTKILLPPTVSNIGSLAFSYIKNSNIYFTCETPATIQSNTFTGMSNTNLWVPYNNVNEYRTAANWSTAAVSSAIKGYAPANTFTTGQTLPTINYEGYSLTWYSDRACTIQVTTVDDPTAELYCTVGTTILAYRIKSVNTMDCTVTFSDGTNTYVQGDMVPVGTSLTITSAYTDSTKTQVYKFDINGTDYKPATSETITVASDITVMCLYYDGVNPPVNPNFGENSWEFIKLGAEMGLAASLWSIGDEKTDSNGNVWRIVDLKPGRYAKVGGGTTSIVIEKVNLYAATTTWRTSSNSEHYGQSALYSKMQSGGTYYQSEDQALAALVNDNKIIVKANQPSTSTTVDVQCGFFAPSNNELGFSDFNYATYRETINDGTTFGAFQYYDGAANSKRVKTLSGSAYYWWTRSRYNSSYAVFVDSDGSRNGYSVTASYGACPCVAF